MSSDFERNIQKAKPNESSSLPVHSELKRGAKAKAKKEKSFKDLGFQVSEDENSDDYSDVVNNDTYEKLVSVLKFI